MISERQKIWDKMCHSGETVKDESPQKKCIEKLSIIENSITIQAGKKITHISNEKKNEK